MRVVVDNSDRKLKIYDSNDVFILSFGFDENESNHFLFSNDTHIMLNPYMEYDKTQQKWIRLYDRPWHISYNNEWQKELHEIEIGSGLKWLIVGNNGNCFRDVFEGIEMVNKNEDIAIANSWTEELIMIKERNGKLYFNNLGKKSEDRHLDYVNNIDEDDILGNYYDLWFYD